MSGKGKNRRRWIKRGGHLSHDGVATLCGLRMRDVAERGDECTPCKQMRPVW